MYHFHEIFFVINEGRLTISLFFFKGCFVFVVVLQTFKEGLTGPPSLALRRRVAEYCRKKAVTTADSIFQQKDIEREYSTM